MKQRHLCIFKNGKWNILKDYGIYEGFRIARLARDAYREDNPNISPLDIECFLVSICEKHNFGEI